MTTGFLVGFTPRIHLQFLENAPKLLLEEISKKEKNQLGILKFTAKLNFHSENVQQKILNAYEVRVRFSCRSFHYLSRVDNGNL